MPVLTGTRPEESDECDAGPDRPADTYTIDEMVATGATAKQVDHWTRAGLLHPVPRANATSGVPRRWPATEHNVCARMALLVDVGLSVTLAHQVARHPGAYLDRGVTIRLTPAEQAATATDREILRRPGRTAVATALHALLGEATAAAALVDEVNATMPAAARAIIPAQPAAEWPLDTLLTAATLLTGPHRADPA